MPSAGNDQLMYHTADKHIIIPRHLTHDISEAGKSFSGSDVAKTNSRCLGDLSLRGPNHYLLLPRVPEWVQ